MPDPSPAELARLLAVILDPALSRRAIGRLRPRVVGRPHPIRRLRWLPRPGLVRVAPLEAVRLNPGLMRAWGFGGGCH